MSEPVNKQQIGKQTTANEIAFLDAIVTNRNTETPRKVAGKIKALEGYIRGSTKRVKWDLISSVEAIEHAKVLLDGLL